MAQVPIGCQSVSRVWGIQGRKDSGSDSGGGFGFGSSPDSGDGSDFDLEERGGIEDGIEEWSCDEDGEG
jgi:hypothetical protein